MARRDSFSRQENARRDRNEGNLRNQRRSDDDYEQSCRRHSQEEHQSNYGGNYNQSLYRQDEPQEWDRLEDEDNEDWRERNRGQFEDEEDDEEDHDFFQNRGPDDDEDDEEDFDDEDEDDDEGFRSHYGRRQSEPRNRRY